uniref:Uncharacterized protein n=1 Tax=Arundo donax TaxID=35708 RepID=A0A0A9GYM3_ARUDO
MRARTGSVA